MKPTIGFVGVGRMGANMARCLKGRGYAIAAVQDRNAQAAQALAWRMGEPDAFPCTDHDLQQATQAGIWSLADQGRRWRPWRALALAHLHAWSPLQS